MTKVKMRSIDAGPKGVRQPGQIVEVDEEEAKALVDGRYAVYVDEPAAEKTGDIVLTLEEFETLSAGDQKGLLEKLEIEGDDGNAEKRAALYAAHLGK